MCEFKKYIRIGEIPPNEESGIYRGDRQVGKEVGVSVYNGILIDDTCDNIRLWAD